jgi:hypothetical protein
MEIKNIKENKISIIKKILPNLNLDFVNYKIINLNIDTLSKVFETIKSIYLKLPNNINDYDIQLNMTDSNLRTIVQNNIHKYIDSSNSKVLKKLKTWNKIFSIRYENLYFFYLYTDEKTLKKDLNKILFMFKIFISLSKFTNPSDTIYRYVEWIPIDSDRDFDFEEINSNNLEKCVRHYKAFTVSGMTWGCSNCNNNCNNNFTNGSDPRITIITRYEEIEKLLIHELVHNLYLDGSNYHGKFNEIINKYNNVKNKNNYNYEFSIYESYTELLSTYFYLLFKNINEPIDKIKKILFGQILIEIIYSYNTIVNIIKLNKYQNYNDFIKKEELVGSICFYEYYYIKGLLYNNLILSFPKNFNEFVKLYERIITIAKNSYQDKLLKHIFEIYQKQLNYKYIIN